ncbi:type VII secretion target [Saccharothrix sp.]|uniref:type VII secretion target n=1 Tax=Saccharothrix sp. TaxID=1873460 RepID=UPI00281163EC|nr:type VII secretion target [Saccharothrix sp.]
MSGFKTSKADLEDHAKLLDGTLSSEVREAVDAAGQVKLGAETMGVICQVYSFIFNDELDTARDLLAKLPEALDATGAELRASANLYDTTDQGERRTFDGMNG